jgi:Mor family transcriptional regulator
LEGLQTVSHSDEMANDDPRQGFIAADMINDAFGNGYYFSVGDLFSAAEGNNTMYCDHAGNIRVIRVY